LTAQMVILNKFCVGLSSDSSVTLVGKDGPKRTFPTAEKITSLPSPHSIAVLHSGSTEFLGIPYSVLLVEWIRTIPPEPLPTVTSYRDHLNAWILQQKHLFPAEMQDGYFGWMVRDFFLAVRRNLLQRCEELGVVKDDWSSPRATEAIDSVIEEALNLLGSCAELDGWEDVDVNGILDKHRSLVDEAREWVFDDTPRSSAGDEGLDQVVKALLPVFEDFAKDAVLAFVGFGSEEVFPAMDKVSYQGMVDGHLRVSETNRTVVSTDMDSSINPLGQTEAVNTFLRAYNESFLSTSHQRLEKFAGAIIEGLELSDGQRAKLVTMEAAAHEDLGTDFEEASWSQYLQPMLNTVAALPIAEVARMAEALVGLQVLRQLTQADAETVGGPIDVAIITRQDGFQWVRHKSLSLN